MVDDNGLEPLTLRTSNIEVWMNGKNVRKLRFLQVLWDMLTENFQLVVRGPLNGSQLVRPEPQGKPLAQGHTEHLL